MRIRLQKMSDGTLLATGVSYGNFGSAHFRSSISQGNSFIGIPYDELVGLLWIETDDSGNLIDKVVRSSEG